MTDQWDLLLLRAIILIQDQKVQLYGGPIDSLVQSRFTKGA